MNSSSPHPRGAAPAGQTAGLPSRGFVGRYSRGVRARWVAFLPLLALLSGCAVDQRHEVSLYRRVLDARVPRPATEYQPGEMLTLQRAMALANQSSEELGVRGEDYVQALINKNRAAAAFFPTVSFQPSFTLEQHATGGASTSTGPGGTGIGSGGTGGGVGTTSAGSVGGGGFRRAGRADYRLEAPVVGNINLFRGWGDVANVRAAEAIIAERRELLWNVQATVLLNVAQVYYQVLRSEQSVAVLRDNLRVQEARYADVEQQFRNGLAIRLSVAQTRAQVDATRVILVQAESDVRNGRSTLANLLGVPAVRGPLADSFAPPADLLPEAAFEEQAQRMRTDLRAARADVEAARQGVKAAFAQYYPSVSLNVSGFLYREFLSDASKWNSILSANLPIFSAGIIEADVRNAWSRLRQAALNESAVRRQIATDVQLAFENFVTSDRRVRELEDEVQASEEAFQQAQNAFRNSLAINLDVLTAQNQLLNAQLELTSARFDRTVFFLDLVRATGAIHEIATSPPTTRPTTGPASRPATAPG